ncbi:hypothetical protein C3L33_08120, partial [Rhododendron williamsianum]
MAVASADATKTETVQSVESSPSRRASDAASDRRISDAASDSSSGGLSYNAADPPNYSRELEIQVSPKSEEYRNLFRLPQDEVLLQDFNCALQENFLLQLFLILWLQGHMYVFSQHICFYSNLFGFETKSRMEKMYPEHGLVDLDIVRRKVETVFGHTIGFEASILRYLKWVRMENTIHEDLDEKKVIPFNEVTAVRRAKAAGIFPTAIEIIAGGKKYFFTSFLSRDEAFKLIWDGWCQYGNGSKECTDSLDSKSEPNIEENGELGTEKAMGSKHLEYESDSSKRHRDIPVLEDPKLPLEGEDGIVSSLGVQDNVEEDAEPAVNNDSSSSRKSLAWVEENSDASKGLFFSLFCSGAKFGSCQEVQKFRVYRNRLLI